MNYKTNFILLQAFLLMLSLCFTLPINAALTATPKITLSPVIKKAMPSVVAIAGIQKIREQPNTPNGFFSEKKEQTVYGFGSGVIINAKLGHILTNAHVISELEEIQVRLHDQRQFNVKILGLDKATDLALLQIEADNLVSAQFADSDLVEVGDFVIAIGNPLHLTHSVTTGIVSALSRNQMGAHGYYDFIQTDAAINVGNSGGGLFNVKGELIAINTMILSSAPNGGNIGLGFAIPINMARSVVWQLAHSGRVQRAPLGVFAQDLSPLLSQAFHTPNQQGALITEILPHTPAQASGLHVGDVILKINHKSIKNATHLQTQISLLPPNSQVDILISRSGKIQKLKTTMQALFSNQIKGESIYPGLAGAILEESPPDYPFVGLKVVHIEKPSVANQSELQVGDLIIGANQQTELTIDRFKALGKENPKILLLQILRDKMYGFVAIGP